MTEAEWDRCADPAPMLEFLCATGRASDRKLRLFAVACCRRLERGRASEELSPAVLLSEGVADGRISKRTLREIRANMGAVDSYSSVASASQARSAAVARVAATAAKLGSDHAADSFGHLAVEQAGFDWRAFVPGRQAERGVQAVLLRDVFGPLAFREVCLAPSLLRWNDGTVVRIARSIYEERRWAHMPILADALLDAGCDEADVLAHCRGPGPHVRGCCAIDLILGRR